MENLVNVKFLSFFLFFYAKVSRCIILQGAVKVRFWRSCEMEDAHMCVYTDMDVTGNYV